jgi:hypothetical protein
MILNAIMGSIESKDGLFFKKGPGEEGGKPARKLTEQKFDKIGVPRFVKGGLLIFLSPIQIMVSHRCCQRGSLAVSSMRYLQAMRGLR